MSIEEVHAVIAEAFDGIPVYAGKTADAFEVAVPAEVDENLAFDRFCAAADQVIEDGLINPSKEALTWRGALAIMPPHFVRLGG